MVTEPQEVCGADTGGLGQQMAMQSEHVARARGRQEQYSGQKHLIRS
jgi:hypothetical protein